VAATEDGYGIVVGLPDAPAEVEIYTEPQCEHCADFQARFGEDLRSHLQSGLLAVVYRPLTFLDDEYDTDYSAAAANALFLAAAPLDVGVDVPVVRRGPVGESGPGPGGIHRRRLRGTGP
jgi:protein-disulfide isomerase